MSVLRWLLRKIQARRCPCCRSRWGTELLGWTDHDEDWHCWDCGALWVYGDGGGDQ